MQSASRSYDAMRRGGAMTGSASMAKPVLGAVALALSFAVMGVWVRMMDAGFATFQQVYLRILLGALIAIVLFRRSLGLSLLRDIRPREWGVYGLRALLAYTVGVGFFTIAVMETNLATVSFVASLPMAGVLAWLFYNERLRLAAVPFIGLSVLGLFLITAADFDGVGWGEAAAVISMVAVSLGQLMARSQPKRFTNQQNTVILLAIGWIPVFLISVLLGEPPVPTGVTLQAWIALVVSAVLNIAGLYLVNYVFTSLKAYVVANLLLLQGIFAVLVGLSLYGERPTLTDLAGAVLISGSAYAVSRVEGRASEASPTATVTGVAAAAESPSGLQPTENEPDDSRPTRQGGLR